MRERLGILVVDRQQGAGEVVSGGMRFRGDEFAQVATVGRQTLGVVDLLLRRRPSPGEAGAVAAPFLELRPVALWDADEAEDDPCRQRERQRRDEVEWSERDDSVQ